MCHPAWAAAQAALDRSHEVRGPACACQRHPARRPGHGARQAFYTEGLGWEIKDDWKISVFCATAARWSASRPSPSRHVASGRGASASGFHIPSESGQCEIDEAWNAVARSSSPRGSSPGAATAGPLRIRTGTSGASVTAPRDRISPTPVGRGRPRHGPAFRRRTAVCSESRIPAIPGRPRRIVARRRAEHRHDRLAGGAEVAPADNVGLFVGLAVAAYTLPGVDRRGGLRAAAPRARPARTMLVLATAVLRAVLPRRDRRPPVRPACSRRRLRRPAGGLVAAVRLGQRRPVHDARRARRADGRMAVNSLGERAGLVRHDRRAGARRCAARDRRPGRAPRPRRAVVRVPRRSRPGAPEPRPRPSAQPIDSAAAESGFRLLRRPDLLT